MGRNKGKKVQVSLIDINLLWCFSFSFSFFHFQATDNPKVKNRISLELSFVNSNLQLLKEKLSELNSSVEIYQNDSHEAIMPFIPVGLKETVDIKFMDTFSERVRTDHYSQFPIHMIYDLFINDDKKKKRSGVF